MKKPITIFLLTIFFAVPAVAQEKSYAAELAKTAMGLWKDSLSLKTGQAAKWDHEQGVVLKGIENLWNITGDGKWFNYIQKSMDFYVQDDGTIKGYKAEN